jgi:hypothetical protein
MLLHEKMLLWGITVADDTVEVVDTVAADDIAVVDTVDSVVV